MTGGWVEARALPEVPWDLLLPLKERASAHGLIDLSMGTPVDPTPEVVQAALREASNAPGYPTVWGTPALRDAIAGWMHRRLGVEIASDDILPTIGSKELVAMLPFQLGLGERDVIAIPSIAYPTYDIGARLAGCPVVTADGVEQLEAARVRALADGHQLRLVWLNSPSNPTGAVLTATELAAIVEWGRRHRILIVNDECYTELAWDCQPISLLHPSVCGPGADAHHGVLAVHSLSKRSNLAGYRAAFIAGDAELIRRLLEIRKHAGSIVPMPIQSAMLAAYDDDAHVARQHAIYASQRSTLLGALRSAGFQIDHSQAGLFLWLTRGESGWDTAAWFADRGVLVVPGDIYGAAGARHVRMALTARDADIAEVARRLA